MQRQLWSRALVSAHGGQFFLSEMRVSKSFKLWLCNSSGVWTNGRNTCFQFRSRNGGRWTIFAVFETRVALATTVLRELRQPVVPEWAVVCGVSNETGRWRNCCGMPNLRLDFRRLPGPVFDPPRRGTAGRVTRWSCLWRNWKTDNLGVSDVTGSETGLQFSYLFGSKLHQALPCPPKWLSK